MRRTLMYPRVQKGEMLYNISPLEAPPRHTGVCKAKSHYHGVGTGSLGSQGNTQTQHRTKELRK
jgi:hypothetical protein